MATTPFTRYRNSNIISGSYYETFEFPDLSSVPTFNIRTTSEDRLDTLAAQYLGAGQYWWILAMMNNISWAFDFTPGNIIMVPVNAQDVLKYF